MWWRSIRQAARRSGGHRSPNLRRFAFRSVKDGVHRLDAATGKETRLFPSGLSLIGETLYVATLRDGLKAFDMASGELVWHRPLDKGGVECTCLVSDVRNDILLVATSNPGGLVSRDRDAEDFSVSIVAVNAGDGSVRWQYQHIRNDVWDLDLVSNPIVLHDLRIDPLNGVEDVVIGPRS